MSTHPATCKSPLAIAIATLLVPSLTHAAAEPALGEVVVTAARMQRPLEVVTDPKAPRQPLPAHDGADYLKTIPGFAVIRKGGTDGDPVFRGMAASRVNISVDGEQALGGCGMRMDPPTAYIYPETFDRVVVVKGPQTVLHGPGNSAATVIFERDRVRLATPGVDGEGSLLGGSFGRNDVVARLRLGNEQFQGELQGTRAQADDYEDGAGREVHSAYERWSGNGALAWTPDERTVVELTGALSDGEASYADRAMDGVKFARDNVGLKFERRELGEVLRKVEAQAYYNYVDHVMDNYSLRDFVPSAMMPAPAVSNPDRKTTGARAAVELALPRGAVATVGLDSQRNVHTLRSTMNQLTMPYELRARVEDARFEQLGAFGEFVVPAGGGRVVAGLRGDQWQARDQRETLRIGMSNVPNPTAKAQRDDTLWSGFARYERGQEDGPLTWYGGVGHVERFPDYWELVSAGKESLDSLSAFGTRPERTTQLDVGVISAGDTLSFSVSGFYSRVDDFILIQSGVPKGMRSVTVVRNIDAETWGGEADASWWIAPGWKAVGTLAYVQGQNNSDDRPLAQLAPLEARVSLSYEQAAWSAGALFRGVLAQDRYAVNQGNIVGQDLGPTPGFGVLSLNAGWRPRPGMLVSAGIDNLLDRDYAEHLSRSGAMVAGFEQTTRVHEAGRTLWLKLSAEL